MAGEAAGFWSYVQKDDDGDNGRILALADDLRNEYRIQTGDELELGLSQLLMSVYWVDVPALDDSDDSNDEAIRHIGKYQWQDLRNERFEERDSSTYRRAISDLASEIAERAAKAESVDDVPEDSSASSTAVTEPSNGVDDADDEPGLIERIVVAEEAMSRITEILGEIGDGIKAIGDKSGNVSTELDAAAKRGQGMKAALTLTNRLAHELEEPSGLIEGRGQDYAKALSELDPRIHAWLDIVESEEELDEDQVKSLREIADMVEASDGALTSLEGLTEEARTMATYSRSLRAPVRRMRAGLQGVLDGRAVLAEWGRRSEELLARAE